MQITYTGHAYLYKTTKLEDVLEGREPPSIMRRKYDDLAGYTYLGPVTVTTECRPQDEIVCAQIENLRAMLQTVRAENQERENFLIDQISKLTAIGYTEAA